MDSDDTQPEIMRFFVYDHLPTHLRPVAAQFAAVAKWTVREVPDSAERDASLRKLLEAKDCAVRASLDS